MFQDSIRTRAIAILSDDTFQQIAPLIVLLLVPLLVLTLSARIDRASFYYSVSMGLDSLGLSLPWSWSNGHTVSTKSATHDKKKKKRSSIRTRADQLAFTGAKADAANADEDCDDGYFPGLVNISGTYCFMNSTLQAMSSLSYLLPHIDAIHAKAEALDVPTPVIDALRELFQTLNTPRSSYNSIRPIGMIDVLTKHTEGRHNTLMCSREHQDAQELFQLLSECIKNETAAVDKEAYRDRGLGGLSQAEETNREIGKSVFDGLTANRRSCVECGYTEAVMHFAFDNWQLAVPRLVASVRLEDCLADYTRLELLTDCICRKCSVLATHRKLIAEAERLADATKPDANPSASRKKRAKEVRKLAARVRAALDEGRIEDELKDVKMEKVFSKASTKQAMIARPPPVLALHINRSVHFGQYASKNNVRIIFPEILDLTPYTTSGNLSTVPSVPISSPPPTIPRSTTPTPATYAFQRTLYRLSAVVCHYGQHSFGHYICYRRKPRPASAGATRFAPPTLADPLSGASGPEDGAGLVWEHEGEGARPGHGWLRISDDAVREVGIETVLQEGAGAFMMYYERVVQPRPGIYTGARATAGSEETLKPVPLPGTNGHANGSATSLVSVASEPERVSGAGIGLAGSRQVRGPRIIRSVAAGRGRSNSAAPEQRASQDPAGAVSKAEKPTPASPPPPNGNALHEEPPRATAAEVAALAPERPSAEQVSVAPLPQVVSPLPSIVASAPVTVAPPPTPPASHPALYLPPRIHTAQAHHPPAGPSPMVGLKA